MSDPTSGYKRPPRHTRYKPGESGNPRGRPKGIRNIKTELQDELAERIRIREGDREVRISKHRALIKALVNKALRGDTRAGLAVLMLMAKHLDTLGAGQKSDALVPDDRAILDAFIEDTLRSRTTRTTLPSEDSAEETADER